MESFLLVIHVIVALLIVGLIMLQQGKGAEMGASFGSGGSQTVFGAAGTGNFFSRLTAFAVAVFFATSFVLAMLAQKGVELDESPVPVVETVVDEVPVTAETALEVLEGDVPELPVEEIIPSEVPSEDSTSEVPEG